MVENRKIGGGYLIGRCSMKFRIMVCVLLVFTFTNHFTIYGDTVETEPELSISRIVSAAVGQIIEVPFRGIEWVFIGELDSRRGMSFDSRRFDIEGYTFIFRAEAPGTYTLRFSRQDFSQTNILNDLVQVIVGEAPESARFGLSGSVDPAGSVDPGRVVAEPRWPRNDNLTDNAINNSTNNPPVTTNNPTASPPATTTEVQSRPPTETARTQTGSSANVPPARETPPVVQAPQTTNPAPQAQRPAPPPTTVAETPAPAAAPNSVQFQERGSSQGTSGVMVIREPTVNESRANEPPVSEPRVSEPSVQEAARAPVQDRPDGPPPDDYIRRAREEFNAGRIESGISILADFAAQYPSGTDEAWWLYAQLLEANTPSRDIKLALEYYRRLVREFPQSNRVADAQRRIAYLERFFINIW